jgi:transcriptional regulator with XRE-family HTH domain
MRVAAVTRFKQGDLYEALKELGWSQSELARRSGINPSQIGTYINMTVRPPLKRIIQIAKAFAEAGKTIDLDRLWPKSFAGIGKSREHVFVKDVPEDRLIAPQAADILELRDTIGKITRRLSFREKMVLDEIVIKGNTLKNVAAKFGVTYSRTQQIFKRAREKARQEFDNQARIERRNQFGEES